MIVKRSDHVLSTKLVGHESWRSYLHLIKNEEVSTKMSTGLDTHSYFWRHLRNSYVTVRPTVTLRNPAPGGLPGPGAPLNSKEKRYMVVI